MRTFTQARKDLERCMRSGERIVAECKTEDVEPSLVYLGNSSEAYIFLTNARLSWMSANNDGIIAVRWKHMISMGFGKKRFKQTMTFSFNKRPNSSAPTSYPAMYVTKEVARVAQGLFERGTDVLELPDEVVAARKVHHPHDNSNIGLIAQAMGLSEFSLECSVCGQPAGSCSDEGDELFDECMGCFRSFSHVLTD